MPWIFSYAELGPHLIKNLLDKVPFCSLPASLPKYKVVFKGKSRKWGGAIATLEKSRKNLVYGSALLVPPEDFKMLDKTFQSYERKLIPIFIEATQDKVKAHVYLLKKDAPYNKPSQEYTKNIVKHLRFFWGQSNKKSLSLEDFGITLPEMAETQHIPANKKTKQKASK